MEVSKQNFQQRVKSYLKTSAESEKEIEKKEAELQEERSKPPKQRSRKLSEIRLEIQQIRLDLFKSKPKRKCSNCGHEIDYDCFICWECGEVFLDICPRCKNLSLKIDEHDFCKCEECGQEFRAIDLLEDLLRGGPNPRDSRLINPKDMPLFYCGNIGKRENTVWDLCKDYNCPYEQTCEYFCPAFLALLGLIERGKTSVGLPWGYYEGGDVHGYLIRWKRPSWLFIAGRRILMRGSQKKGGGGE